MPHFQIPLDLPHAATVSERIVQVLLRTRPPELAENAALYAAATALVRLLRPCGDAGENPLPDQADPLRRQAAALGRSLAAEIEARAAGSDRLGQCVRNLFECLELGEEGVALSLRCGEDPKSPQRAG
ncbi:MAG: hypothetical protein SF028_13185 [Candidatus Sumerlaeia bacterium]|nr:hypothetical protein [Candidatus Sumerlaeia bacterium]